LFPHFLGWFPFRAAIQDRTKEVLKAAQELKVPKEAQNDGNLQEIYGHF
jgi:hypothetical protein